MSVVDDSFAQPMKLEERAAMSLAGGLMGNGYQCGMIWGAALAAGTQAYRLYGMGAQAEAVAMLAAQRLVESFRARNKHINCLEITQVEMKRSSQRRLLTQVSKFFLKGGPMVCFGMAARYAPVARTEINTAYSETYSEKHGVAPSSPVSCAAMLAHKMGMSDMHAVMAAGFAGGIGLSGGACGALGTAIWIMGMNRGKEGIQNIKYILPGGEDVIERFLESADYEFECSKIVGRRFENVEDHARYLRDGGCSKIIDVLASQSK